MLDTSDPEEIIRTVKHISPGFSGILLEDIGSPHCFDIEDRLKEELDIPVMHDDQHGTAVVTLAAAISACKSAGLDLKEAKVGQIGLGAAGVAICRMFMAYGVKAVCGTDKSEDAMNRLAQYGGQPLGSIKELMDTCDIVISTTGVPGLIKKRMSEKDTSFWLYLIRSRRLNRKRHYKPEPLMQLTAVQSIMFSASRGFSAAR